jgi:Flp pilus assembly pilin Flp
MGSQKVQVRVGDGVRELRRFRHNCLGATALEFAMLAGPLLALVFGILAVGLVFVGNMTLENAVDQGARVIRTGEAQSQGFDAAKFQSEVCKYLTAPLSCGGLKLDVKKCSSFGACQATNPLDSNGNLKSGFSYDPGIGGDVIIVRAFYEWDLMGKLPVIRLLGNRSIDTRFSNMGNGDRLLIATAVFRNEPFKL